MCDSSVPRVERGPCKLDLWDLSVPRVEKGQCKLDLWDLGMPRVEKGQVSLIYGIQVCQQLKEDHVRFI